MLLERVREAVDVDGGGETADGDSGAQLQLGRMGLLADSGSGMAQGLCSKTSALIAAPAARPAPPARVAVPSAKLLPALGESSSPMDSGSLANDNGGGLYGLWPLWMQD